MTYKHLTTRELTFIYNFWKQDIKAYQAAKALKRSSETVYRVYRFLDAGNSISQFQENHRINKTHCGRKAIELPEDETKYIKQKLALGWTPDTIIGRAEIQISCSMRTLYRLFQRGIFNVKLLPMKGKRHPNGYVEQRGKAGRLGRSIYQRYQDYPHFKHPTKIS